MTRVLIASYPDDIHATIVAEALQARGHEAVLWHGADFPTLQHASVSISDHDETSWEVWGPSLQMTSSSAFDVVWQRRPVFDPVLPSTMHPGDRIVAQRECSTFTRNLWHLLSPQSFWVNPLASRQRSNAKLVQLAEAISAGLRVPPTLCSNDPTKIRAFLERYEGQTVFKPFHPALWVKPEATALSFTSPVGRDDLPEDEILRLTPGIFQQRIPKDYELRLTYMGGHQVAAKLLSQEIPAARLDWKLAFSRLRVVPIEIPATVDRACRHLLARLGIVFACIDMIVTPDGEHVFLEVNEMGQFLWLEESNPDLRLLDPFCEMLAQARPDFRWRRSNRNLRFADLCGIAEAKQRDVFSRVHVTKPAVFSVVD
jgi:glutathione synthase/RimK-type ligase-like ATP-grasp enzyme